MPYATARLETYCTSGPSPTTPLRLHLLGVGAVARALLARLPNDGIRVVGATDRSGTVLAPEGLEPSRLARHKAGGAPLAAWPGHPSADPSPGDCDVIVDLTPTDLARGARDAAAIRRCLGRGLGVVLASKHAVCADPSLLEHPRLGANAVLGGTGHRLQAELAELRTRWTEVALVGSASTTLALQGMEEGLSLGEGLERARRAGALEPDPELDLRGVDAAVKLALVVGALCGRPVDPGAVEVEDLRSVDTQAVRERAARGLTTRLVGRARRGGPLILRYEAVPRASALAVPAGRVAYLYALGGEQRLHFGEGVGADGTADAVLVDLRRLGGVR